MIINYVQIDSKKFDFNKNSTLITSEYNSTGKTTLLRSILYGLGYQIPSTRGFDLPKRNITINISNNGNNITINRNDSVLRININNKNDTILNADNEGIKILSIVYGIDNPNMLKSLLGISYFDQEKGWTLLNRGTVIGGIRFNINDYVSGIIDKTVDDIYEQKEENNKKIRIYKQILSIKENEKESEYNENLGWNKIEDISNDKLTIDIKINRLKNRLNTLSDIQKTNKSLVDFVTSGIFFVRTDSEKTKITKDNLESSSFDINKELLIAQKADIKKDLNKLYAQRRQVEKALNGQLGLLNIEDEINKFNNIVLNLNIDTTQIKKIINGYKSENSKLNDKITKILKNNDIVNDIYIRVLEYSKILGVRNYIDDSKDFIFTSNLKQYSGAKLHLIVFAFKMALLKEFEIVFDKRLTIILDSPLTGELDENNLKKIFLLLKKEFKNYQLIVASIINDKKIFDYDFSKTIELNSKLLD